MSVRGLLVAMGSSRRRTSSVRSAEGRSPAPLAPPPSTTLDGDNPLKTKPADPAGPTGLNLEEEEEDGAPEPPTCSVAHYKALLLAFKTSWKDYCNATALHGMRYLFEEGRSGYERAFWVVALVMCMVGCFQQIHTAYNKWDLPPVLVSFAENSTPVWRVPFPAVTVCPEIKSRRSEFDFLAANHRFQRTYNHTKSNSTWVGPDEPLTDWEMDALDAMSLVCNEPVNTRRRQMIPANALEILREVAPTITETMFVCSWQNSPALPNCTFPDGSPLFTPILMDVGLCFTFNMLDITELLTPAAVQFASESLPSKHPQAVGWNPESGYPKTAPRDTYPSRALGDGGEPRLNLLLLTNMSNIDYLCSGPVQGFKVQLHSPAELPLMRKQYFRVPHNREVVVAVRPVVMTTSDELRNGYQPSRRQCFFSHERQLRYFRTYTQNNCELECKVNLTRDKCGCAAFFMPRASDIPICGTGFIDCLDEANMLMVEREIQVDLHGQSKIELQQDCHCLPACNSLQYEAKPTQADYEWRATFAAFGDDVSNLGEGSSLSRVSIFFEDTKFFASRRSALYGESDFLASCGGLLGLFSGFSLISLVEIMYHLSIRLWCNARRYHHRRRERHRLRRRDQDPEAQEREHEAGEAEGGGGLHADTGL